MGGFFILALRMVFRTELFASSTQSINLQNRIFTIGSCFADAIGQKLSENKFNVSVNPFGPTYNPVSIHRLLALANTNTQPNSDSYLEQNGLQANYHFHSKFSSLTAVDLKENIISTVAYAHTNLVEASVVMITYGAAWVYKQKNSGEVVNNCHKTPTQEFEKCLLSVAEIVKGFADIAHQLKSANPSVQFILTLSPVRHVKDTLELNSVSKSVLRQAIYEITQQHKNTNYFPAYEIMMDDLRDYRFYKSDMLHPSKEAEEYIWQKFSECYFDDATQQFLAKWKEIRSALAHKAFHPTSKEHQTFLKTTLKKVMELTGVVDVDKELTSIKSQIKN
jgi:GSCFA family